MPGIAIKSFVNRFYWLISQVNFSHLCIEVFSTPKSKKKKENQKKNYFHLESLATVPLESLKYVCAWEDLGDFGNLRFHIK